MPSKRPIQEINRLFCSSTSIMNSINTTDQPITSDRIPCHRSYKSKVHRAPNDARAWVSNQFVHPKQDSKHNRGSQSYPLGIWQSVSCGTTKHRDVLKSRIDPELRTWPLAVFRDSAIDGVGAYMIWHMLYQMARLFMLSLPRFDETLMTYNRVNIMQCT